MASVENLDNLPMTTLETLLKACLAERPDIAGHILTSDELSKYIQWMVSKYGHQHGKVTQEMLPYFTPDNTMTAIAEDIARSPKSSKYADSISRMLSSQSEEGYIAPGRDISVGRMLRHYPSNWHTSNFFTVYYCFSGECPIHFRDEIGLLKRGDVLIVAPGVLHATPCFADDSVLAFYMMRANTFNSVFWNQLGEDNLLSRFFRMALESRQATAYINFSTEDDPEIRHLMLQIYREHQESEIYSKQMTNTLMRLFFLLLLRRYEGTAKLPRTESFFWKHQFSAILSYIQNHYQHATLNEVAEQFHYSGKQVGRIVKDCTGESFGELVRRLKMKKAAELLRDYNLSAEETAYQVGYSTVNSFYRSFTDYYGQPPLGWLRNVSQ